MSENYDLEEALALVDDDSIYPEGNIPDDKEKEEAKEIIRQAWEIA
jgi:hypothetical protein